MENLVRGIHQFQSTLFKENQELFERLSKGQQPETLLITCSDSRIAPNLLLQTKPGDLFVLRNAGNLVPP
ncbi:MAG TPA: carbonic anhydrase, partial [Blastocatellia bacterium]|nr:carbonic anhydrase [Blastocatellia bacterium]